MSTATKPRVVPAPAKEATHFVMLHENVLASWIKDVGSLGSLAALIYVNHVYGSGHWTVDATGVVLFWLFMFSRVGNVSTTKITRAELRMWAFNVTKGD